MGDNHLIGIYAHGAQKLLEQLCLSGRSLKLRTIAAYFEYIKGPRVTDHKHPLGTHSAAIDEFIKPLMVESNAPWAIASFEISIRKMSNSARSKLARLLFEYGIAALKLDRRPL